MAVFYHDEGALFTHVGLARRLMRIRTSGRILELCSHMLPLQQLVMGFFVSENWRKLSSVYGTKFIEAALLANGKVYLGPPCCLKVKAIQRSKATQRKTLTQQWHVAQAFQ